MTTHNIYRNGKVHVMGARCPTCIFRPGDLMHLTDGRVDQMVAEATADDFGSIVCHSTLYQDGQAHAVCRGFFDRHATNGLRMARRLDAIEWVTP